MPNPAIESSRDNNLSYCPIPQGNTGPTIQSSNRQYSAQESSTSTITPTDVSILLGGPGERGYIMPFLARVGVVQAAEGLSVLNRAAEQVFDYAADAGDYLRQLGFGYQPAQSNPGLDAYNTVDPILGGYQAGIEKAAKVAGSELSIIGKASGAILNTVSAITGVGNVLVEIARDRENGEQLSYRTQTELGLNFAQIGIMGGVGLGLAAWGAPIIVGGLAATGIGYATNYAFDMLRESLWG